MKIAVVTSSYPKHAEDPSGHFVRSEVQLFLAQGHQVDVLSPGEGYCPEPGCTHRSLGGSAAFGAPGLMPRVTAKPWLLSLLPLYALSLHSALRAVRYDRVVAHWLVPSGILCALQSLSGRNASGRAHEFVAHGSDVELLLRLPLPARQLLVAALDRAGSFRFVASHLRESLGQSVRGHCQTAVGASRIQASPLDVHSAPPSDEARRRLGLGHKERIAVCVARLLPSKRVDAAVEWSLARGYRCVVLGDGPLSTMLRQRFPQVEFLGHLPRSQTLTWISAADALVSASALEGAPTAIREALALGTPVWSAPVGDLELWAKEEPQLHLCPELAP